MKRSIGCLGILIVFSMINVSAVYAFDVSTNMNVADGKMVMLMVLQAAFLFIGASIVQIDHKTFGKAIWAALGIASLFFFLHIILTKIALGDVFGFVVGGILSIVVIQQVFSTTFSKALGTFMIALGGSIITVLAIF